RHVRLAAAVAQVLPPQVGHRLPALPGDHDRRVEEQALAGLAQPVVELVVLVGDQPLVPAPDASYDVHGVGAEGQVVDLLGVGGVVVLGVPDPEPAAHGGCDGPAGRRLAVAVLATADTAPPALPEMAEPALDVRRPHPRGG